ncbi:hypothetical protein [Pseudomonas fluorescens]|uniref:hypothetical protein n=1 Tax=Pseudomonas fluorescens TaxID=294 RepID=UPI000AFBC9A0|nr:hypothetical protein [Pseudomonas fluorescens]
MKHKKAWFAGETAARLLRGQSVALPADVRAAESSDLLIGQLKKGILRTLRTKA